MNIGDIVGIAGLSITIIAGYTTLVFKLAKLTSALNQNSSLILDVRNIVVNQDERIDGIDKRLTIIETKHAEHHKE